MITLLTPPIFPDKEKTRKARVFYDVVVYSIICIILPLIFLIFTVPENYVRWVSIMTSVIILGSCLLFLNRRGYYITASFIYISFLTILIFSLSWSAGGMQAPALQTIAVIVIAAGLLLSWKTGVIYYLTAVLGGLGFVVLDHFALLPPAVVKHSQISLWIIFTLNITLLALLNYLSTKEINRALQDANHELDLRIKTEKEHRISEARLKEAQRIARLGNWELDHEKNELFWSEEVFNIFGADKAHFRPTYEGYISMVHPEDRDYVRAVHRESLDSQEPFELIHRIIMSNRRIKHVQEQCETTFNKEGRPLLTYGTAQDITERIEAENKIMTSLKEKETLLRELYHRT